MIRVFRAVCVAALAVFLTPTLAQAYSQNFEKVDSSFFQPIVQKNAAGATIQLVPSQAHTGKKSAQVSFKFTGSGYINVITNQGGIVASHPGKAHFSMRVLGSGSQKVGNLGLFLLDAGNETFFYSLGTAPVKPLAGSTWQVIKQDFDVTKYTGHWGDKNTGVIKYPIKFLGLGFDHPQASPDQGKVLFDDLVITSP